MMVAVMPSHGSLRARLVTGVAQHERDDPRGVALQREHHQSMLTDVWVGQSRPVFAGFTIAPGAHESPVSSGSWLRATAPGQVFLELSFVGGAEPGLQRLCLARHVIEHAG